MTDGRDRILVLGAGLAGLAAAERLSLAGLSVTVVDSFPLPGGRFASFEVPGPVAGLSRGDVVEHGLHAFFQHYHALYGMMKRAGLPKPPFAGRGVYFWHPDAQHYVVEGGPLFWFFEALGLPEPLRGPRGQAFNAFLKLVAKLSHSLSAADETDRLSAHALLTDFGVPSQAIDHVFRPCLYSLTSLSLERLSALELMRWMSSILPDPRMRSLQGGGSQALCGPIAEHLAQTGVDFRFGIEVTRLALAPDGRPKVDMMQAPDRTGLRHVLVPGFAPAEVPEGPFDAVISTLPWEKLLSLSDASLVAAAPDTYENLRQLHNIHPLTARLWFERPIEGAQERYILSSGTVFDVLRPTPEPNVDAGIVLLDALVENIDLHLPELGYDIERYVEPGEKQTAVLGRILADLEQVFPGQIADNRVRASFVHTREGIMACEPGTWRLRPPAHIGLDNVLLAGDFTQQPYGVCMEGATRSGQLAAECLLAGKPVTPQRAAWSQIGYSLYSLFVRT